jgi:hypothetical protein
MREMSGWNYSSRGYDSTSDDDCDGYPFTTGLIRRSPTNGITNFNREQSVSSMLNYSCNSIDNSDNDDHDEEDDNDDDSSSGCGSTVSTISGKSFASNTTLTTITNIMIPVGTALTSSTATMRRCSSVGSTIPTTTETNATTSGCNYMYSHSITPPIPTPNRFISGMYHGGTGITTTYQQQPISSSPVGKVKQPHQQRKRRKKKVSPPSKNTSLLINVVLLLLSIMCILTPFYFAILYALPKSGNVNATNTNSTIIAPSHTAGSIGSTLAVIGGDSNTNITKAESKIYDSILRMNSMKMDGIASMKTERKDREFLLRSRDRRHRLLLRKRK